MEKTLTLYHGSNVIIKNPKLADGKQTNDYGKGFYMTEHKNLASEWASKFKGVDGFCNKYTLDFGELKILDLMDYNILFWITLLLKNRNFTITAPISEEAMDYLFRNFNIDVDKYDVIKGYRADDSYFSFAEDFISNAISVEHLSFAMKLGKLGIQYALISDNAFKQLDFFDATHVDNKKYYPLHNKRDLAARKKYRDSKRDVKISSSELFILDIIRNEVKADDPRIQ